jgi:Plant transposon protein
MYCDAVNEERQKFASVQESVRINQWQILDRPLRFWYKEDIVNVLVCCISMHNVVVKHRRKYFAMNDWMQHAGQPRRQTTRFLSGFRHLRRFFSGFRRRMRAPRH